jgi:Cys-tRNA synthase (O-phospho-L-seryl-tRNA:Cys-tRNA synthase)
MAAAPSGYNVFCHAVYLHGIAKKKRERGRLLFLLLPQRQRRGAKVLATSLAKVSWFGREGQALL